VIGRVFVQMQRACQEHQRQTRRDEHRRSKTTVPQGNVVRDVGSRVSAHVWLRNPKHEI
jgi:hypothetical protein